MSHIWKITFSVVFLNFLRGTRCWSGSRQNTSQSQHLAHTAKDTLDVLVCLRSTQNSQGIVYVWKNTTFILLRGHSSWAFSILSLSSGIDLFKINASFKICMFKCCWRYVAGKKESHIPKTNGAFCSKLNSLAGIYPTKATGKNGRNSGRDSKTSGLQY